MGVGRDGEVLVDVGFAFEQKWGDGGGRVDELVGDGGAEGWALGEVEVQADAGGGEQVGVLVV